MIEFKSRTILAYNPSIEGQSSKILIFYLTVTEFFLFLSASCSIATGLNSWRKVRATQGNPPFDKNGYPAQYAG